MLTIKKRFPSEKLYLYGGAGFVTGFAMIMFFLVQTNTHIMDFAISSPIKLSEPAATKTEAQSTSSSETATNPILDQDEVFSAPSSSSSTQNSPASETPVTPTNPEPAPTTTPEPTPAEPETPTEPTPTEPTPEEPTNPIEVIIDVL